MKTKNMDFPLKKIPISRELHGLDTKFKVHYVSNLMSHSLDQMSSNLLVFEIFLDIPTTVRN